MKHTDTASGIVRAYGDHGPFRSGIWRCDYRDLLNALPNESVDLILTDPPYDTLLRWKDRGTAARFGLGKEGRTGHDPNKLFAMIRKGDFPCLMAQIHRVLKPERHAYIFADFETMLTLWNTTVTNGLFGNPTNPPPGKVLVWDKVIPGLGYTYRSQYELILMLWKGKKRKVRDITIPNVLRVPRVQPHKALVPTQKPIRLMKLLVMQSTAPGEIVCDPFMGAATTAVAAWEQGRDFIGSEIDEEHWRVGADRLNTIL